MRNYYSDKQIIINMRRMGCWYLKNTPGIKKYRCVISRVNSIEEIENFFKNFD